MNFFKNVFDVFCQLSRNTYFNECPMLVAASASSEQKHTSGKHCMKRHFYHLLKTPNYIALFISPDDYDTTVNRKENGNVLMFLMFLHFTEAATRSCSLKKVFTTCGQKTLECFQWLWLLTIINFITEQPFVKHPFLKNTSPWPLLTSKFYYEFDFMFCYHKVRMLQKVFPSCFLHGL